MEEADIHRYNELLRIAKEKESEGSYLQAAQIWAEAAELDDIGDTKFSCWFRRGLCMSFGGEYDAAKKVFQKLISEMQLNEQNHVELLLGCYLNLAWNEHDRNQHSYSVSFFRKAIAYAEKHGKSIPLKHVQPFFSFQKEELERLKMHGDKVGMEKVAKDILRAYEAMHLGVLGEPIRAEMKALGVDI